MPPVLTKSPATRSISILVSLVQRGLGGGGAPRLGGRLAAAHHDIVAEDATDRTVLGAQRRRPMAWREGNTPGPAIRDGHVHESALASDADQVDLEQRAQVRWIEARKFLKPEKLPARQQAQEGRRTQLIGCRDEDPAVGANEPH